MPATFRRVRGSYGTPWSKLTTLPVSKKMLTEIAECLVQVFVEEAKKDFAKRGWSRRDPQGGPDIGKSFGFRIRGKSTIEITSSFYGLPELASGGIPERKMTWLTQEAKEQHPERYKVTDSERRRYMARRAAARRKKGVTLVKLRGPLIVPLSDKNGRVIFRTAPLKIGDAWVHPGIAKFTFAQRAIRKAKKVCKEVLGRAAAEAFAAGDPTK